MVFSARACRYDDAVRGATMMPSGKLRKDDKEDKRASIMSPVKVASRINRDSQGLKSLSEIEKCPQALNPNVWVNP